MKTTLRSIILQRPLRQYRAVVGETAAGAPKVISATDPEGNTCSEPECAVLELALIREAAEARLRAAREDSETPPCTCDSPRCPDCNGPAAA